MNWIKKHPYLTSAAAVIGGLVWWSRSSSTESNAADTGYSSGTVIVGTPNPLGQIASSATDAGSATSYSDQLAQFFQSQTEQAKSAQLAAQTAVLASTNTDNLKALLGHVGKGQDFSIGYNDLGQITGLDISDQPVMLNPLQEAQMNQAVYQTNLATAQIASAAGATNPTDIALNNPVVALTAAAQKQIKKLQSALTTATNKSQTASTKSANLIAAGKTGAAQQQAQKIASNQASKAATIQSQINALLAG